MKLFDKKGLEAWHILLGIVIIGVVLFIIKGTGGCSTDEDCLGGYTCSMDGQCIKMATQDDGANNYIQADGICEDNEKIKALVDPDCPKYCPPSRKGSSGLCCLNEEGTATVDCTTGEELFPENWNNVQDLQAIVTWGDNDPVGTSSVSNRVEWTAPGSFPGNLNTVVIWLDSVTISPSQAEWSNRWTDANCVRSTGFEGCFGKGNGMTAGVAGSSMGTGSWLVGGINFDNMAAGDYVISYKYCAQDSASTVYPTPKCATTNYNLKLEGEEISFTVSADI